MNAGDRSPATETAYTLFKCVFPNVIDLYLRTDYPVGMRCKDNDQMKRRLDNFKRNEQLLYIVAAMGEAFGYTIGAASKVANDVFLPLLCSIEVWPTGLDNYPNVVAEMQRRAPKPIVQHSPIHLYIQHELVKVRVF
jgi:hypothetical protein